MCDIDTRMHASDNCPLRAQHKRGVVARTRHSQLESDSGICSTLNEKLQESLSRADGNYSSRLSSACSSAYSSIQASPAPSSPCSSAASSCCEIEARVRQQIEAMTPTTAVVSPTANTDCNVTSSARLESARCNKEHAVVSNCAISRHPTHRRSRLTTSSASSTKSNPCHASDDSRRLFDPVNNTVYEKKRLLGKGGFARVYEVHQAGSDDTLRSERVCAAKVIDKSRISRPQQREKVDLEVQLLKEAHGHPNIVGFYHSFEDDSSICILLELCNKKSLAQYLRRKQYLPEQEVCNITNQIVSGLGHLHGKGIIHRDLKLGNILLTDDMVAKIGDFGLASRVEAGKRKTICGTPNFIAPEVLQRQGHGPEADIWALGCLLYTMLVGKPPFETSCLRDTYKCILKNNYRIPATMTPEAADLIRWMLRHKPKSRPTLAEISSHAFFAKHSAYLESINPAGAKSFKTANDMAAKFSDMRLSSSSSVAHTIATPGLCGSVPSFVSRPESEYLVAGHSRLVEESVADVTSVKEDSCTSSKSHSLEAKKQSAGHVSKFRSPVKRFTSKIQEHLSKLPSPGRCTKASRPASSNKVSNRVSFTPASQASPSPSLTWVSKWVDYSNRYGFGYQLASGRICVLFNDGKHLAMLPDQKMMEYSSGDNSGVIRFSVDDVPASLERYANMLRNFTSYMEKNLSQASNVPIAGQSYSSARLLTWHRTDDFVAMYLSDGSLQVNFCRDHVKINISNLHKQSTMRFTVVDEERNVSVYDRQQVVTSAPDNVTRHLATIHSQFHAMFDDVACDVHPFCGVCMHCATSRSQIFAAGQMKSSAV